MPNPLKVPLRRFAKHVAFEVGLKMPLQRPASGAYNVDDVRWLIAAAESARFIDRDMPLARPCNDKFELLDIAMKGRIDGHILEFGVASGETLRHIGSAVGSIVHGFDSFEGLPETWTFHCPKGTFAQAIPEVGTNARLWIGWFDVTVPEFVRSDIATDGKQVSLIHIDCDLYSSTKTVLDGLAHMIKPGTRIVFDEYFNYPGWRQHEHKAFREFCAARNLAVRWLGYVPSNQQAAVEIVERS
jgi:hypothetical protein